MSEENMGKCINCNGSIEIVEDSEIPLKFELVCSQCGDSSPFLNEHEDIVD